MIQEIPVDANGTIMQSKMIAEGGMSLRDWFAGMALQGLTAHPEIGNTLPDKKIAGFAYSQADAMLAARERKEAP